MVTPMDFYHFGRQCGKRKSPPERAVDDGIMTDEDDRFVDIDTFATVEPQIARKKHVPAQELKQSTIKTNTPDEDGSRAHTTTPEGSSSSSCSIGSTSSTQLSLLQGDVRATVAALRQPVFSTSLPSGTAYLVFDTETTGRSARAVVCQMAMAFVNADHQILCMYNKLWKLPRGRFMSKGSMKVHGITPEQIRSKGVWPAWELTRLERTFKAAIAGNLPIVAFNASFDARMLRQTAEAIGFRNWTLESQHLTCTCTRSRVHSDLRDARGARKGFSNAELFFKLFHRPPDGDLHDAATDVVVTACSYAKGRVKRWW